MLEMLKQFLAPRKRRILVTSKGATVVPLTGGLPTPRVVVQAPRGLPRPSETVPEIEPVQPSGTPLSDLRKTEDENP
jgi:hypothetical protein